MELKFLSLFFIFIFSVSGVLDKADLETYKKETKNNIEEIIKNNNLKKLLEEMRIRYTSSLMINKSPPSPESFKLICELVKFDLGLFKKAFKTLNSHYKKNNPDDPFYKEFKNNIELILNHLLPSSSSYWIYAVYVGIFLGGFGISYTILYFLKRN
ncbi:hypothetical protein TUBRATIS_11830 [Tubulinosema ratisbonensis]|uniref:Uncharacterized protein n=1 Tax=Tubulinosema ratisbonensis TaxID=291195 RepID=A0A437AMV9_9MICR|nr:hypothetical protein TUBRATIS_11830 [Tubulinosema ratisbonensis]